jgi:hypothetical protein
MIKDYLTDEIVAICTEKKDAVAMIQTTGNERKLIIEKGTSNEN